MVMRRRLLLKYTCRIGLSVRANSRQ